MQHLSVATDLKYLTLQNKAWQSLADTCSTSDFFLFSLLQCSFLITRTLLWIKISVALKQQSSDFFFPDGNGSLWAVWPWVTWERKLLTDLWHFAKILSDDGGSRQRERVFHTPVKNTAPPFLLWQTTHRWYPPWQGPSVQAGLMMSCSHIQRQDEEKKRKSKRTCDTSSEREAWTPSFSYGEVFSLPKSLPSLSYL